MTEYEKIVDKMIKKYPHARAAFQYFLEQSHYDSMEEFLFDYGYMIDYDLEKYTENEYFYKDGMNNLYYDTIKRRRLQKTADGDTVYRYIHAEDEDDSSWYSPDAGRHQEGDEFSRMFGIKEPDTDPYAGGVVGPDGIRTI